MLGNPAQAFPEQNHDAHVATHMSLLNTPVVQSNAQVQALIISHIMQHLQMKADILAQQQMPPEVLAQYQQIMQQVEQLSPVEARQAQAQADGILAQFSAPIMSQLVMEFNEKIAAPSDEDPLVTIRKQELALRGQELAQDQQQFAADQKRRAAEAAREDMIDRERIQAQEEIAGMRDDTARARLEQQRILTREKNRS